MPLFGYDVKEEAQEIKTELKGSRNDLLLIGLGTLVGTFVGASFNASDIIGRVKSWFGYDQEEYDQDEE